MTELGAAKSQENEYYQEKINELECKLTKAAAANKRLRNKISELKKKIFGKGKSNANSKVPRKYHGCGKHCYTSAAKAKEAQRHMGGRVRAYECHKCHAWHITTKGKYVIDE
jgi:hypothetical protein